MPERTDQLALPLESAVLRERTLAMARRDNPASSHEAAQHMVESGKAATNKAHVLAALRAHDHSTAAELVAHVPFKPKRGAVITEVRRRLSELRNDGLVIRGTPRFSANGGGHMCEWRVKE